MEALSSILSDDGTTLQGASEDIEALATFKCKKFSEFEIKQVLSFLDGTNETPGTGITAEKHISDDDLNTIISETKEKTEFVSFKLLRSAVLYFLRKSEEMTKDSFITLLNSIIFAKFGKYEKTSAELFVFYIVKYFSKVSDISFNDVKPIIDEYVEKASKDFFNVKLLEFLLKETDDIELITKLLENGRDELPKQLKYIDTKIFSADEKSQKVANFVLDLASEVEFSDIESCSVVGSIISSAFKADISEEMKEKMMKIVFEADKKTPKNPLFVVPMLNAFMYSPLFNDLCPLVNDITEKRSNIISLHEAKIDVQITKTLKAIQDCSDISELVIDTLLEMLTKIAVVTSSSEVARSTLALFNPTNGCLSKYHSKYVAALVKIVSLCIKNPESYFNNNAVTVEGVSTTNFAHSFFAGMWIYIPSTINVEEKSRLFSFMDINGNGFAVYSQGTTLYGYQYTKGNEVTLVSNDKLPQDCWFHLGIQFVKHDRKMDLIQSINGTEFPAKTTSWIDLHKNSTATIKVGEDKESQCFKGAMAIFSSLEAMQQMVTDGPRASLKQSFACVKPLVTNNKLVILGLPSVSYNGSIDVAMPITFIDSFVRSVKVQAFLPILETLDLKLPDGQQVPAFSESVLDLILLALKSSERAANSFLYNRGFALVAESLSKTEKRNFDYPIYQKLFAVFTKETNTNIKEALLRDLILNLNLWVRASSIDQIRITRHWGRVIYQDYADLAFKVYKFTDILSLLRVYYWYTPIEKNIICNGPNSKMPREEDLNIHDIRSGLLQALHTISRSTFDREMLQALIGDCITCKDFKQVVDLLLLVKMIAVSEEQPLLKVKEDWGMFSSLHHLINCENEEISFTAIEDIAALHLLEYITEPKVKYHVATLMEMAPLSTFSLNFFGKLISFTSKYPDFLPFSFFYAMQAGEKAGNVLMDYLTPSNEFSKKKMWALWPIISALYIGGNYCKRVMDFIARSSNENWKLTFSIIDVVALALGVDDQQPKSWYIHSLTLSLLDQPLLSFEYLHQFFDLAIFHMFCRPKSTPSYQITEILKSLNFPCDDFLEKATSANSERFDKQKFINQIEENKENKCSYRFGLRLGANGEWLDAQCGLDLIMQAKRTKVQTYHNFSALLASFALHDLPEEARKNFEFVKQAKIAEQNYIDFFAHRDPEVKGKYVPSEQNCIDRIIKDTNEHSLEIIGMSATTSEKIIKYFQKVDDTMMEVFQNSNADLFTVSLHHIVSFSNKEKSDIEQINMNLNKINHCFSVGYGPFKKETVKANGLMVGDECCKYGIPMKTAPITGKMMTKEESFTNIKSFLSRAALAHIPEPTKVILQQNESDEILLELQGQMITKLSRKDCLLYILSDNFQIITDEDHIRVEVNDLEKLLFKTIHHMPTGVELTTRTNKSYLVSIDRYNSLTALRAISNLPEFKNKFIQVDLPIEELNKQQYTEKWQNGKITNLEYIMYLNYLASRSFNSLACYPICPFVLKPTANNEKPDLTKEESFRDFTKPMVNECKTFSSPKYVSRILSCIEPFKTYSDEECFNNYTELYENALQEGYELPPELYSCSYACEPYYKSFGCSSPEEFVSLMRSAIESDYVRKNLPKWIDIVFGVNQPEFDKELTEDAWKDGEDVDPSKRFVIDERMETEGMIPQKLFTYEHPEFHFDDKKPSTSVSVESNVENIRIAAVNSTSVAGVTNDNKLMLLNFDNSDFKFKNEVSTNYDLSCITMLQNGNITCGTGNGLLMSYDKDSLAEKFEKIVSFERVTCIDNDETLLVCGTSGGYVSIYDSRNFDELASIQLFSGEVKSVVCLDSFGLIVAITETRLVAINQFDKKQKFSFEFKNNENVIPPTVCITNQTGIIVAAHGKKIATFTINGKLINEAEIDIEARHVCSVAKLDDTFVVSDGHKAEAIDPISLKVVSQVADFEEDEIMVLSHSKKPCSFASFSKSGQFSSFTF